MSALRLHLDEDADSHAFLRTLRHRGVDVTSTGEEGLFEKTDEEQLAWAAGRDRVVFSYNAADFCRLHAIWARQSRPHAGIIIADQQTASIGEQVRRVLKLQENRSGEDLRNQLEFLANWR